MRKHKTGFSAAALLVAIAANVAPASPANASYRVIGTRGGFLDAAPPDDPSLLSSLIDWLTDDSDGSGD